MTRPSPPALADDRIELRIPDDVVIPPDGPPVYLFAIHPRGGDLELGRILLRLDRGDPGLVAYAGHIGFEVAAAHRDHRHALHATRLLRPLALGHGFTELWISTTPDNAAARRTLELLGAQSIDTVAIPPHSDMQKLGITIVRRYRWTL